MNLQLRSKGVRVSSRLRRHVERRVALALGHLGHRVQRIRVRLSDLNGPKGGEDVHCVIHAHVPHRGELVIQERHHDPFAAVTRASERVRHALSKQLDRLRARRRRRR